VHEHPLIDLLVIGGGPAGLSAALYAGRARRHVVVVDDDRPRHGVADGVHNLIGGLEGIAPQELRRRTWASLAPFDVHHRQGRVRGLTWDDATWTALLDDGSHLVARAVLLAVGVVDLLPDWPGLQDTWGHSVHVCPFCHGWELRDRPLAAYGQGDHLVPFARMLRSWSDDVVVLTGDAELSEEDRSMLDGVTLRRGHPVALEHDGPQLTGIRLSDGELLPRAGLFLGVEQRQTPLVRSLALETTPDPHNADGWVVVDGQGRTNLPLLWAAGDLCTRMQQVSQAIAAGGGCGAMVHATLAMS